MSHICQQSATYDESKNAGYLDCPPYNITLLVFKNVIKSNQQLKQVCCFQYTVDNSLCEEISEKPALREDCEIPCSNDCILSPWSPWSYCAGLCQEGHGAPAVQKRDRTILARAGEGISLPCFFGFTLFFTTDNGCQFYYLIFSVEYCLRQVQLALSTQTCANNG